MDLDALEHEQALLDRRLQRFGHCADGEDIWRLLGWREPEQVPLLRAAEFVTQAGEGRAR